MSKLMEKRVTEKEKQIALDFEGKNTHFDLGGKTTGNGKAVIGNNITHF